MMRRLFLIVPLLIFSCGAHGGETSQLADDITPLLNLIDGTTKQFTLTIDADFNVGTEPQHVKAAISRTDDHTFSLSVEHPMFPLILTRDAHKTILALPAKGVQFVGEGAGDDALAPTGVLARLISNESKVSSYYEVVAHSNAYVAAMTLNKLAGLKLGADSVWTAKSLGDARLRFTGGNAMNLEVNHVTVSALLANQPTQAAIPEKLNLVKVDRKELEHMILRGVRRATEVLAPDAKLAEPEHENKVVFHGQLRWVGEQRAALLWGTPQQIGHAHGKMLKNEIRHCCDSTLYLAGLAATINSGKWFPDELRGAYARLEKYIPDDHKAETDAMADAAEITHDEAHLSNVFPELFHCSGFAVFGKATADGKLYHGRVLDYMTEIGLQDSATVFVISPNGKNAFANVGYAGFIGSVSGMNERQISLGEMGGRGQGHWDGVPMATLMRRALEECNGLDDVKQLWTQSPRTCEYYYVFADGKIPSAVGVAATPEKVEFLLPGQSHELLGPGIDDAVVLSAGSRLTELRRRVQEGYGKFTAESAEALMCRPVAMKSNLHNVLFVPHDGIFYVANASHKLPAAEQPYTKYDLMQLIKESKNSASAHAN